jgi:hypothetical protein
MRRSQPGLAVVLCALIGSAVGGTPALADPAASPNALTITLTCPFGEVTGTAPTGSAALILESGGIVTLHGVSSLEGDVLGRLTPGLESNGKLVQCTFFSPSRQQEVVAHVLIVP